MIVLYVYYYRNREGLIFFIVREIRQRKKVISVKFYQLQPTNN